MAKSSRSEKNQKEKIRQVTDKDIAENLGVGEKEVAEATQVASSESSTSEPLPLSPGAIKFLEDNRGMMKVFTEDNLRDRSIFLGRDLTVEDMEELYGPDTSMPEDTKCSICVRPVAKFAYRAAVVISEDKAARSNGELKRGELSVDRFTNQTIQRGLVVAWIQKDTGELIPEAFCFRDIKEGRLLPKMNPEDRQKKLPAQTWEQAVARAEGLNARNKEKRLEQETNLSKFRDRVGPRRFENRAQLDRRRGQPQPTR